MRLNVHCQTSSSSFSEQVANCFFFVALPADCVGCVCRWWCVGNAIRQQLQPLIRTQDPGPASHIIILLHPQSSGCLCSLLYSLPALLLDYCINFICVMLDTNIYRLWKLFSPCVRHSEVSSNSFIESYSVQRTQVILQSSGDLMINLFQGLERLEIFLLSVSKSIFLQFWWYFIK